jgi:hypothetical protein
MASTVGTPGTGSPSATAAHKLLKAWAEKSPIETRDDYPTVESLDDV